MQRIRKLALISGAALAFLVLFFLVVPYLIPIDPYRAEVVGPFEESVTTLINGARIHYRHWEPESDSIGNLVFVHGFCGSTFSWRHNIPFFVEQGWRVVAVDLPAFGYSDRAPEVDHSIEARNGYVWGVLDEVSGDAASQWWLCGHSMGGGVIEAMAQLEAERTAGVIFVDGGGWGHSREASLSGSLRTAAMGFGPVRRWTEVYAKYAAFSTDNIRTLLTGAFNGAPDDETTEGYVAALKVPRTASAILDQWRGRSGDAVELDTSTITAPSLIVWGAEDTWVPIDRGHTLHEAIEHSEMAVIEGAGHNVMETHVQEFNETVHAFMAGLTTVREPVEPATPE